MVRVMTPFTITWQLQDRQTSRRSVIPQIPNYDLSTMAGRAMNIADGQSSLERSSEVSQDILFTLA